MQQTEGYWLIATPDDPLVVNINHAELAGAMFDGLTKAERGDPLLVGALMRLALISIDFHADKLQATTETLPS